MTIRAKSKDIIAKLIILIKYRLQAGCTYDTYLHGYEVHAEKADESFKRILQAVEQEATISEDRTSGGFYAFRAGFLGTGRWSYLNNIENFKHWLSYENPAGLFLKEEAAGERTAFADRLFCDVRDEEIYVDFDFVEDAAACKSLYEAHVEFDFRNGTYRIMKEQSHARTPENLRIFGYDTVI